MSPLQKQKKKTRIDFLLYLVQERSRDLGSVQNDLWSRVGITSVAFMSLATATMSLICEDDFEGMIGRHFPLFFYIKKRSMDTYSQSHLVKSTIGVGDYIASGCTVGS